MNTTTAPSNTTRSLAGTPRVPLISIVDDDDSVRVALKSLIGSVGFRAEVFGSGEEFLNSPYVSKTDCLIADVRMPRMSGLELQERLNAAHLSIPVVFISAHDDGEARARGPASRSGRVSEETIQRRRFARSNFRRSG